MAQQADNLGSVHVEITDENRARIADVVPSGRMGLPYPSGFDEAGEPHAQRW